jgi:hypothetical protein
VREFISEADLDTFEGWLRYQGIDAATATADELKMWRGLFDEVTARSSATAKVGLMKLRPVPGEYRYAVAIREGSNLWLTLWVRRSRKGEIFVIVPRGDRDWDPHTSYHLDGTLHSKSHGHKFGQATKRQPLTNAFKGTEHLGIFAGHGPQSVGAVCDPAAFSGIVEVGPGVLGPRDGWVSVDLIQRECKPIDPVAGDRIVQEEVFRDAHPWIVIRVGSRA